MQDVIAIISGVLIFFASIPYIIDTLKGKTHPNAVSWFTWTLLTGIATWAAWSEGAITSAILTGADTLGMLAITLLAIKFGVRHYTFFDIACQVTAMIGVVLWFLTNEAAIAIVITVVVDLVALLPTLRHSWLHPAEETWITFAISGLAALIVSVTVPELTFVALAYPLYLIFANLILSAVILYRRRTASGVV